MRCVDREFLQSALGPGDEGYQCLETPIHRKNIEFGKQRSDEWLQERSPIETYPENPRVERFQIE